jgi:hypothetical protein
MQPIEQKQEKRTNIQNLISNREVTHQKIQLWSNIYESEYALVLQSQLPMKTQTSFFLQRQILMQDILISLQNRIILRILGKVGNTLLDISLSNTKKPFNNTQKKNI